MKARYKLFFSLFSILTFLYITNIAYAKYCKWDVELISVKDFNYNDFDFSRLSYDSRLEESLPSPYCKNVTIEHEKISEFIESAKIFKGISILLPRPLNEMGCYFIADSSNNVTIQIDYDGTVKMLSPIDGCYDGIPPYTDALGKIDDLSRLIPRSWQNFLYILHLDIGGNEESKREISNIRNLLKTTNYNNTIDVDVGVPELFATNRYFPYATEGNSIPLVFISNGGSTYGVHSGSWRYPILFFKLSAMNTVISQKLEDIDKSLDSDIDSLTKFRNNVSETFQDRKNIKEFEIGIKELEIRRGEIINFKSKVLNSSEIKQVSILMFLEENEMRSPDTNQNKFSTYYFEQLLSKQIDITKQLVKEIQNKEDRINTQKEQIRSMTNDYINDLSILKQIEDTKLQIILVWVTLIVTVSISLFADWDDIKRNSIKLIRWLSRINC